MMYSQTGIEPVLEGLLDGCHPETCCEFGAHNGITNSNTAMLIRERGWNGLLIEQDEHMFADCRRNYQDFPNVQVVREIVTAENVNDFVQAECQFLSIDVDGNDFWIWFALDCEPGVVCIEYNARREGPASVMQYDSEHVRCGEKYDYGASRESMLRLGELKGYRLVHDDEQCNLIFQKRSSGNDPSVRHETDGR